MARIAATGLATAAGAVLTSLVDSRSTLVGAVLVAMAVSALGQAMRTPLDRLERRIKRLGTARAILVIGLVGFLVAMGAISAHELAQGTGLRATILHKLEPRADDDPVRAAPTTSAPEDEDAAPTQRTARPASATPATRSAPAATPIGPKSAASAGAVSSSGASQRQEPADQ